MSGISPVIHSALAFDSTIPCASPVLRERYLAHVDGWWSESWHVCPIAGDRIDVAFMDRGLGACKSSDRSVGTLLIHVLPPKLLE